MLTPDEREELKYLRMRESKVRQVLMTQEEHEACSFVRTGDWSGLEEWARERGAQEAQGGESATVFAVGRDRGGGMA